MRCGYQMDDYQSRHHVVTFDPHGTRIAATERMTILDAARQAGLHISSDCGGNGTCGHCVVQITPVVKATSVDRKHIDSQRLMAGFRLACIHRVIQDMHVRISGYGRSTAILEESLMNTRFPEPDDGLEGQFGIAIDIGTTTIVCYLIDLGRCLQLGVASALNPQASFGEDLMSRLTFACRNDEGVEILRSKVLSAINSLIHKVRKNFRISTNEITRVSVVGNTAMHHFFLGLDVDTLAISPFVPIMVNSYEGQAIEIGLHSTPSASVYCAPNVAGFVGGDAVSFALALGLDSNAKTILGIDLGTNSEVILSHRGRIYCCSTAAGPAFEGATLVHGSRAVGGAIEHVSFESVSSPPMIATIGGGPSSSLCGSAVVDILQELLRMKVLDSSGRLLLSPRTIRDPTYGLAFEVVRTNEHDVVRTILLTQQDIRKIQLAKSAIRTGIEVLMEHANIKQHQLETIYLAGAFGTFLQPQNAMGIGLLPQIPIEKVIPVGNAAGEGAKRILVSTFERRRIERIAREMVHVNLAQVEDINDRLVENLKFPKPS